MPRNGAGIFSLAEPPFIPNTVISSSAMNSDLSDIAAAMTASLARDGQGGMTAVLPLFGTGFNYISDPNTGIRRSAVDTQEIYGGGLVQATIGPTEANFPVPLKTGGALSATGNLAINTDKFTVTAANGNTQVAGTFGSTGAATLSGTLNVSGATTLQSAVTVNSTIASGAITSTGAVSGETVAGNMIATTGQMESAAATNVIVTPGRVRSSPFAAKVWAVCAGSTGAIQASEGVQSVVRNSTGNYTIAFNNNFSSDAYAPLVQIIDNTGNLLARVDSQSTSQMVVSVRNTTAGSADPSRFSFAVFGDLA